MIRVAFLITERVYSSDRGVWGEPIILLAWLVMWLECIFVFGSDDVTVKCQLQFLRAQDSKLKFLVMSDKHSKSKDRACNLNAHTVLTKTIEKAASSQSIKCLVHLL